MEGGGGTEKQIALYLKPTDKQTNNTDESIPIGSLQMPSISWRSLGSWLKTEEEKLNPREGSSRVFSFSSGRTLLPVEVGMPPSLVIWMI